MIDAFAMSISMQRLEQCTLTSTQMPLVNAPERADVPEIVGAYACCTRGARLRFNEQNCPINPNSLASAY
jgi:hypothetical protein